MSEKDQAIALTAALLDRVPNLRERLSAAMLRRPVSGSAAKADHALALGHLPWTVAGGALSQASEPVYVWHLLLNEHGLLPSFSHLVLLRATLEGTAVARWVLTGAGSGERIERAVRMEADSHDERAKFETSFGVADTPRPGKGKPASRRVIELAAEANAAGVTIKRAPNPTDLIRDFAVVTDKNGEWLYRALSAVAHAKSWCVMATELGERRDSGVPKSTAVKVTGSPLLTFGATKIVVDTLEQATREFERYATGETSG